MVAIAGSRRQQPERFMANFVKARKGTKVAAVAGVHLFLTLVVRAAGAHYPCLDSWQKQNSEAEAHLDRGLELAQTGELQPAEDELRLAMRLKPDDAEILSSLATVLAIETKLEESTHLFERALKLNPGDLRSRRHLAANLYQMHRYAEAGQNLKIVLKVAPADPQAGILLGLISEATGDYPAAVAMLASFPALTREQPEAAVALAQSYYRTGNSAKAVAILNALAKGTLGPQGALLAAQVADQARDFVTAERLLNGIPAESPDRSAALYRLATVKFHAKQYDECDRILQGLLSTGTKNDEVLRLLGWCYHRRKLDEEAIATFRRAIQLMPAKERNYLDLGALLLEQRKFTASLELANRTVNAFPHSGNALALLGSIEFAMERFTDAVITYSRAIERDRNDTEVLRRLAKAQAAAGMSDQAEATLRDAIQRFPGKASFEVDLAEILLKKNDWSSSSQIPAEQLLRAAAKHDPMMAEAQSQLGELALRQGRTALAVSHLENAVKLSPESARAHFALARGYRQAGRMEEAERETSLYEKLKQEGANEVPTPAPDAAPSE
jgi:tetratricopeptide (TPR) repeat protein